MKEAQQSAEELWAQIANGSAAGAFPQSHFPATDRDRILIHLKEDCQLQPKDGKLAGRRYFKDRKNKIETASLAYEFPLRCDTVRFVLSYDLTKEPIELFQFRIDQIEDSNILADRFGGL